MSDDGYAHSSYDDLEDFLYDADPEPELADELAEHTLHSPVYRDEDAVQTELQDYFSDWEYYSDDYMDDDPKLLKRNSHGDSPTQRTPLFRQQSKRGTKRKLAETRDVPGDNDALVQSIAGVVWGKCVAQEPPIYKDGQDKKVALMKNWRQIFNTNGWTRSSQGVDDESWAKDMSLIDMGLQSVQRQPSFDTGAQPMTAAEEEEEEEEEEAEDDELEDGAEELGADDIIGIDEIDDLPGQHSRGLPPNLQLRGGATRLRRTAGSKLKHELSSDMVEDEGDGESDPGGEDSPRKRRRIKPNLPSPPSSNGAPGDDGVTATEAKHRNMSARSQNDAHKVAALDVDDIRDGRKRKATDELEETSVPSAKGRAKRIASMKVPSSKTEITGTPSMPRATRSKAKRSDT
jgi:hypothetical protein